MTIKECKIINLPKINDPRGNLTFIEADRHVPFAIKRVFYLYDVPGGADRAGHALKKCHQFLIGLHLPPMLWREIDNFSSGSVCLALASEPYDEKDYFRDYREYLRTMGEATA
jgi:hypothetical protein